MLRVKASLD